MREKTVITGQPVNYFKQCFQNVNADGIFCLLIVPYFRENYSAICLICHTVHIDLFRSNGVGQNINFELFSVTSLIFLLGKVISLRKCSSFSPSIFFFFKSDTHYTLTHSSIWITCVFYPVLYSQVIKYCEILVCGCSQPSVTNNYLQKKNYCYSLNWSYF